MFKNKNKLESTSDIATYKILTKVSSKSSVNERKDVSILDWVKVRQNKTLNEGSIKSTDAIAYKDIVLSKVERSSEKDIAKRVKEKSKLSNISNYSRRGN